MWKCVVRWQRCFVSLFLFIFFFNDTATTEIYTLSPTRRSSDLMKCVIAVGDCNVCHLRNPPPHQFAARYAHAADRKSTRLNSSHDQISYAVFCLKKKNRNRKCTNSSTIEHLFERDQNSTCLNSR